MTDLVSRLLDFLGGHFYHILLGCVLVIAAVLVLEFLDWRLRRIRVPEAADLFMFYRITEEYQRENEYLQKLTKAEEASQFKTSFLFRMFHEIRTPINGITGPLMLAESKLPEGHEAMQYLSNAVRFTEKGEITVTFRQMLTQAGRVDFLIRVHDTGIGMQPEFIDCIFHPFEQEESGAAAAELQEELLPGKVLLAEDNELNAMIVVEILQSRGLKVDVAEIPIYALSADAFVEE